jgi:muramoyltetrapeptide carboxypeptidase
LKLQPLKKGDVIAIAAPAGPFDRGRFLRGVALLRKAAFKTSFRRDIFSRHPRLGYLAGDDRRRAQELRSWLQAREPKALLFARGGFGSQRILPLLDGRLRPKVLVGSSDLTALLNYLWKKRRLPSLYGPMVAPHLILPKNVSRIVRALTDPGYFRKQTLTAKKVLKPGGASGRLIGGCLSLLISTLRTPWEAETRGSILFLEDTNEEPYAVDRMLTQLEQAGKLKGVRGIVFGTFRQGKILFPPKVEKVLRERLKTFRGPVLWGLRFGHCRDPLIIPFGGIGRIKGNQLLIEKGIFE